MRTNRLEDIAGLGLGIAYVLLGSLSVALIVFGLAYAQQLAIWNWTFSLGPDLYVAAGMAVFAFVVTAVACIREG
jgi:hypothetical protein